MGKEAAQRGAVAFAIDVADERLDFVPVGIVAIDQLDAGEASRQRGKYDVGADPVHGVHAGIARLRVD
ncbi:hypothetical protein D9M68_982840 [compost metagenome]